jgi:lipid-binding SYLF domain-containing protein
MKKTLSLLLMSVVGMAGTYASAGSARQDTVARLDSSVEVVHAIMATPDKGIPEEVLSNAKCILVVPNMIKGGFIFGGKHDAALLRVVQPKAGAHRRSSRLAVGARDSKSASKASTSSCWS